MCPGYCSAITRSNPRADSSNSPSSGGTSAISTRSAGLALGEQGERTRQDRLGGGLQDRDAHRRDAGLQGLEFATDLLLELERAGGVRGERDAVLGEPHPAAVRDQQGHAGVLLELGELLRDRRGTVGECFCDRCQGSAQREFVQQPESAQFEHGVPPFRSDSFIDEAERYRS